MSPTLTVAVSGASGFLGSCFCNRLVANGYRIRVHSRNGLSESRAGHLDQVIGDIASPSVSKALVDKVDAVVHFALPNEVLCRNDPESAYCATVTGTLSLLRAAAEAGVHRFVMVSTIHSYGRLAGSIDETTEIKPLSTYGCAHAAAELAILSAIYKIPSRFVLRLSHVVGCPAVGTVGRWSLLPLNLCLQAVQHREIKLMGDGSQLVSLVSLSNAIEAIEIVAVTDRSLNIVDCINIGKQKPISIAALAYMISDIVELRTGLKVPVRLGSPRGPQPEPYEFRSVRASSYGIHVNDDISGELLKIIDFVESNLPFS
jgi:UDP-glucose 4-epimerase